ncbi:uncharacterized protein [Watersipora subatra]|uniref:uncharacterized protein n=1 Tax=Watersipora subatra TaxID=2589382 RepID=UPI00355BBB59
MLQIQINALAQLCFLIASLQLSYGLPEMSELHKTLAEAHIEAAKELNNGKHHLNIHKLELPPTNKFCPEHFKCWSGDINSSVYESEHLFLGKTNRLVDFIIGTEQNHLFVWVGCKSNMEELRLSFIHSTDLMIYTTERHEELIRQCDEKLSIIVQKIDHHKSRGNNKPISIHLIVDLLDFSRPLSNQNFTETFQRKLRDGTNNSLSLDNLGNELAPPPSIFTTMENIHPPKYSLTPSTQRKKRSLAESEPQTCNKHARILDLFELEKYIEQLRGQKAFIVPTGSPKFYYCSGVCNAFQRFPKDSMASAPLREQAEHDGYWETLDQLVLQNIISEGPQASCIGYAYAFFEILYTVGMTTSLEYVHYPSQCACV